MDFTPMQMSIKSLCHWAEHPNTIRAVEKKLIAPIGLAGMGALAAADTWKAQPQDKRNVLVRDALVLGATAAGTWVAARGLGVKNAGKLLKDGLMKYDEHEGREELAETLEHAIKFLKEKGYSKQITDLAKSLEDKSASAGTIRKGYKNLINGMKTELETKKNLTGEQLQKTWKAHVGDLFPEGPGEEFSEEVKKALSFFTVGGISVLSGLAGGLAANKINKVQDPDATVNMIKEGIFQFVANIALCAVGAGAALAVVDGKWGGVAKPTAEKFTAWLNRHPAKKLIRTGIIGSGLSIGIFGGSHLANWLGRNYVNPFFDKLQGKPDARLTGELPTDGKRKIEWSDWILHLDDLPTAMALAGVKIVEPFIPLFFAFSGYRTGIGYRNDESAKASKTAPDQPMPNVTFNAQPQGFGNYQPTTFSSSSPSQTGSNAFNTAAQYAWQPQTPFSQNSYFASH